MAASDLEKLILSFSVELAALRRGLKSSDQMITQAGKAMNDNLNTALSSADPLKAPAANMTRTARQMQATVTNLTFQINDVISGLAMGQRPMQVLLQQGGQFAQIFGGAGGIRGALALAGKAIFSWSSLAVIAVSAASYAFSKFFEDTEKEAKKAEDALKNLGDAIEVLRTSTGLTQEAPKPVVTTLIAYRDALRAAAVVQGELTEKTQEFKDTVLGLPQDAFEGQTATINELNHALAQLEKGDYQGAAETLAKLEIRGKLPEQLKELLPNLGDLASKASVAKQAIKEVQDVMSGVEAEFERQIKVMEDYGDGLEAMEKIASAAIESVMTELEKLTKTYQETMKSAQGLEDRRSITAWYDRAAAALKAADMTKKYEDALKELQKVGEGPLTKVEQVLQQHKIALDNATTAAQRYAAELAKTNALGELHEQAWEDFQSGLSSDPDFMKRLRHAESGGRYDIEHPGSSAYGAYGFTRSTWVATLRGMGESFARMTDQELLAMRSSREMQDRAAEAHLKAIDTALIRAGQPITDVGRYASWFLGVGGGPKLMKAPAGASLAEAGITAEQIAANPFLRGKTAGQLRAELGKRIGASEAAISTQDQRERNELEREQARIRGELNYGIDQTIAKEQAELKFAELMADARKEAAEEGKTVSQQRIDAMRKEADEFGRIEGMKAAAEKQRKAAETYEGRLQALKDETNVTNLQLQQLGAMTQAIDQEKVAREAAVIVMEQENALRAKGIEITDAQKAALLAAAEANVAAKMKLEEFNKTQKDTTQQQQQFYSQMAGIAKSAIGGFIQDLRNGVDAGEAFNNMLNRIIDSLIDMALESIFSADAMKNLFGGMFGGGGGFATTGGGIMGALGFKKGGIVGRDGEPMRVDPRWWHGAPQFARGGIVGLPPGAVPIIAHRGEMIVPKATGVVRTMAPGAAAGSGSGSTYIDNSRISIDMSRSGYVAADNQGAKQFGENVKKLIQAEMIRESRPGGILRQVAAGQM